MRQFVSVILALGTSSALLVGMLHAQGYPSARARSVPQADSTLLRAPGLSGSGAADALSQTDATTQPAAESGDGLRGIGAGLLALDLEEPTRPTLGQAPLPLPGLIQDTAAGRYAYVVGMGTGLRVVDLEAPAGPAEVGYLRELGQVWGLAVTAHYAYVGG
jgi:hypothetical protein